jgi:arginyl-tRNA synthetase
MENEFLFRIFSQALIKIGVEDSSILNFERPKNPDHGDTSCNAAMQLAKVLRKKPRNIAEEIVENLEYEDGAIEEVSIAGPGFINVKFSPIFWTILFEKLRQKGPDLGRQDNGKGIKVNVEYVSANPTGMLHIGHGRNAVTGDTVANLYEWMGYDVTREYYFNNAGNQMNNLMLSIHARYMQIVQPDFSLPESAYHGEYIKQIAQELRNEHGDKFENLEGNEDYIRQYGEKWCFKEIEKTLKRMGIKHDVFYNEDSLYKDGKIEALLKELAQKELTYEQEGAIFMKFEELGLEKDRVVVKSTGEPTYRLPDMAYHKEKFERGFDVMVDVFGADHIATIPDVMAGVKALGYNTDKIKVLIHQFVTLTENGEQVKMSKRTGKSYTLDDLMDEVGEDVARYFLVMRAITTHLEFDLGLAKEQNDKNPVFYLQYAHARICSLFRNVAEEGIEISDTYDYKLLTQDQEIDLIKELLKFESVIETACNKQEPHILSDYLRELASAFHKFFAHCRILGEPAEITQARLKLANTTRTAIKNGLSILGIKAPERM